MTSVSFLDRIEKKNPLQGVEVLTVRCHSEVRSTEESQPKRACGKRSLTYVRDDSNVILRGVTPKNLLQG